MKILITFFLSFFFNQCNIEKVESRSSRIVIIKADNLDADNQKLKIFDLNQKLYSVIEGDNNNEPKCDELKSSIKAYYPENYIIHFEGYFENNKFFIKIKNSFYYIENSPYVEILNIEEYILRYYCITDKSNPLRKSPNIESEILNYDLKALSFNCVEIKGDWLKVRCNIDCEGCGIHKNITGWIKWRENGKQILKQKLVC
jgi:hypothetical protein